MKKKDDVLKGLSESLFWVALTILILISILLRTFYASLFANYVGKIILFSWGILLLSEILTFCLEKKSRKEFIGGIVFFLMFIIPMKQGGSAAEFASFLPLAYVARKIEYKKMLSFLLGWKCIIVSFVVFSALIGVITNYANFMYDDVGHVVNGGRLFYCMGFLDHLFLGFYMLDITLIYLILNYNRLTNLRFLFLWGVNSVVFLLTHGRYSYLISLFAIIMFWIKKIRNDGENTNTRKITENYFAYVVPFFAVISLVVTALYDSDSSFWNRLDEKIGHRIVYASIGLKEWGISWFGKKIDMIGGGLTIEGGEAFGENNWIDNAWMHLLFRYGIIFVCLLIGVLIQTTRYLSMYSVSISMLMLLSLMVWMLVDDCCLVFSFNSFLLMLGYPLKKGNFVKKNINGILEKGR